MHSTSAEALGRTPTGVLHTSPIEFTGKLSILVIKECRKDKRRREMRCCQRQTIKNELLEKKQKRKSESRLHREAFGEAML